MFAFNQRTTLRVLESVNSAVVCARTHVAASQFDTGITLSRFKHLKQKGYFKGALCLDEIGMVEQSLLDEVIELSRIVVNNFVSSENVPAVR